MAIFLLTTIVDQDVLVFDPATDQLQFDDVLVSAASIQVTVSGGNLLITAGAKSFTLASVALAQISTSNVSFGDGSEWQVGDGTAGTIDDSNANTLTGATQGDRLQGLGGADTLIGNDGNDFLDGGTGNDSMVGGAGGDSYVVDAAGDVVVEGVGAGIDTVLSAITYVLGASSNLENLTLTGVASINGTGNSLDNYLTGNDGANALTGGDGNDTLNGGMGNDVLVGGLGDDVYVVDAIGDSVSESLNSGHDTVASLLASYTLGANFEDLVLWDVWDENGVSSGTGNTLDNLIEGNHNNNILDGGAGDDTLSGDDGNDDLRGQAGDDVLIGGSGDDTLTGGTGNDTLSGGQGNDTCDVDSAGDDVVSEDPGEGIDTLRTVFSTDLVVFNATHGEFENITLTGTAGYAYGDDGDNRLIGNASANTLIGGLGNDTLDGGLGIDVLTGGIGDNFYVVDSLLDVINENAGAGNDTIVIGASYALPTVADGKLENITLSGTGAFAATGNNVANILTGNTGNNTLTGNGGDDTLVGGGGSDVAWFRGNMRDYDMYSQGGNLVVRDTVGSREGTDTLTGITTLRFEDGTLSGRSMLEFLVNTTTAGDQEGGLLVAVEGGFTIHWGGQGVDATHPLHLQRYDNTGAMIGGETDMWFNVTNQWDEGAGITLTNGGYMLVGRPLHYGDIYYQRYSDASVALTPEVRVDTSASPDLFTVAVGVKIQIDGNPTLSNLGNGGFAIVWGEQYLTRVAGFDEDGDPEYRASEGETRVLARFYDASGNAVSSPVQVNTSNPDPLNGANFSDEYAWEEADLASTQTNDGGVLMVWRYENTALGAGRLGLLGRVFEADGTARGGEFVVDAQTSFTIYDGRSLDAATFRSGSVVVYEEAQVAPYTSWNADEGSQIRLRYFDHNGTVVGPAPSLVESAPLTNYASDRDAHVASLLDGGFVVVWQRLVHGSSDEIFGRRYDANGLAVGDEFRVDFNSRFVSNYSYWQNVEVAGLDSGGFVVTWDDHGVDGSGFGVFAQVFDSGGHKLGFQLSGGAANDTLIWNASGSEAVLLDGGGGNDTVSGGVGDDKVAGGTGDDSLVGNAGGDLLTGGDGNDFLDGGTGDNRLQGDGGTDIALLSGTLADYFINVLSPGSDGRIFYDLGFGLQPGDIVNLVSQNGRIDRLVNVEKVHFLGADGIYGTGDDQELLITPQALLNNVAVNYGEGYFADSSATNILYGTINNDVLDGLGGDDSLFGLSGNDVLLGGAGNDTLEGGLGNDALSGQAGDDSLVGGAGNDNYIVDSAGDVVVEASGAGSVDRVQTTLAAYSLLDAANVEVLEYTGALAFQGAGNVESNLLIGGIGNDTLDGDLAGDNLLGRGGDDSLLGGAGNDILDGGTGNDTMAGGAGDDTYLVDTVLDVVSEIAAEGVDTVQSSVSLTLSANVEYLILSGTSNLNGTGNAEDNRIAGNSGQNILDGGAGNDTLIGGAGNDTYLIDSVDDVADEATGSGIDTVQTSLAVFALGSGLDNLVFTDVASASGTGNALANRITGNAGNDTLNGGAGNDTLIGGFGDDTCVVDSTLDIVTESTGQGTDTVQSSATYTLLANLENLTLTGALAINGTGNAENNAIIGNGAANLLAGGLGNDTIDGGLGTDTCILSGLRTDYRFERLDAPGTNIQIIHNATGETDTLTGIERIRFGNAIEAQLTLGDLLANTASPFADSYTGGDVSSDTFDGLAGNDSISGLGGNDTLYGGADNDSLTGGAGNDTLDGGSGADTLTGGTGNDTYFVDDAGDTVTENANEGIDTLRTAFSSTLSNTYAHLENLTLLGAALSGTGNASANQLLGNANNNLLTGLDGNDTLDGGTGTDTLIGGAGDDTYTMDNIGDVITENAGEGNDTLTITIQNFGAPIILTAPANIETILFAPGATGVVLATSGSSAITGSAGIDSVAFTGGGTYTLPSGVENLQLTQSTGNIGGTGGAENNLLEGNNGANILDGGAGNDTLKGYSGEDILLGGTGNDRLDGGKGADRMEGGSGDDIYYVDNANDQIVEAAASGTDTVRSWLKNTTLGDNLENLILEGTAKANGTGNDLANSIAGNAKANILTGGAGADTFVFNTAPGPMNVDTITDFTTGSDKIALDDAIFGSLSGGWFHSVTSLGQTDVDDHILYDQSTGALYYDADGLNGTAAVRFAMVSGMPALSAADLLLV